MSVKLENDQELQDILSGADVPAPQSLVGQDDTPLSKAETDQLDNEVHLEQQYGNKPGTALVESAASELSLGLTDQALVKLGIETPESLNEKRERSSLAAGTGTALGLAGTLFAPVGVPAKAALKAGEFAAKGTEKALAQIIKETGRSKLAKQVLKKTTSTAVEGGVSGAAYGAGQALREDALGKVELNADNTIASMGAGALLGLGLGGVVGSASAVMPNLARGTAATANKFGKKFKSFSSPGEAAKELSGLTPKAVFKLEKSDPVFFDDLADFYRRVAGDVLENAESRAAKVSTYKQEVGNKIGQNVKRLDGIVIENPELASTAENVYGKVVMALDDEISALSKHAGSGPQVKALKNLRHDFFKKAAAIRSVSPSEIFEARKFQDSLAYKAGKELEGARADASYIARDALKKEFDAVLGRASASSVNSADQSLLQEMKKLNRDFYIASKIDEPLAKRADKLSSFNMRDAVESIAGYNIGSLPGLVVAGVRKFARSDLRRQLAILSDIEKANVAAEKRITESVSSFLDKTKRGGKIVSLRMLTASGFARNADEPKQEPKNKHEAFRNVQKNIVELRTNPEKLINSLTKATYRVSLSAPETAANMQTSLQAGVEFLASKMPSGPADNLLFNRPYEPSSLELAKFERYLQAVEHPLSVLDDLEDGKITREQIEAVKTVYPALYSRIQSEVIDKITTSDVEIPFAKKMQLGILLDIDTVSALTPIALQNLQSSFAPVSMEQPATSKPSAGVKNLSFASRAENNSESLDRRKDS